MKFIIKFIPKTTQHKPLAVAGSKCHQALGIQPKNLILLLYISSVISGKVVLVWCHDNVGGFGRLCVVASGGFFEGVVFNLIFLYLN